MSAKVTIDQVISALLVVTAVGGNYAADNLTGDVQTALRELVEGPALAFTTGIIVAWGASHYFGVGFIADAALTGVGIYFLGAAFLDLAEGLYTVAKALKPNCTSDELLQAGKALRDAIKLATQNTAVAGTAGGALAGAKLAKLLKKVLGDRNNISVAKRANTLKVGLAWHGKFLPGRRQPGYVVNLQAMAQRRQVSPWLSTSIVTDTWLNPGQKIYMIVDKFNTPKPVKIGGWASDTRFRNIEEARQALGVTEQFKPSKTCCDIIELTVKSPVPTRSGYAGPQSYNGKDYKGGGQQYEFMLKLDQITDRYQDYFSVKKLS